MKTIPDDRYEYITTPSSVVVNDYRAAMARKEESASLALIHYRGGETEFALGQQYCASLDPIDRAIGAEILGQLGWGRQAFHDESVSILIGMLEDSDDQVIATAAHALGFRGAESAVSPLLKLVGLAIRKDPSIVSDLKHEWQHEMISFLSIEAAAAAGDPRLLAQLEEFAATLPLDDSPYFREQLDSAISACGGIPMGD